MEEPLRSHPVGLDVFARHACGHPTLASLVHPSTHDGRLDGFDVVRVPPVSEFERVPFSEEHPDVRLVSSNSVVRAPRSRSTKSAIQLGPLDLVCYPVSDRRGVGRPTCDQGLRQCRQHERDGRKLVGRCRRLRRRREQRLNAPKPLKLLSRYPARGTPESLRAGSLCLETIEV